jgi:short-subunit dehydrogenase
MAIDLKPLNEQVIVITGASSGIGLATALRAADRGAKLVLTARSKNTLSEIIHKLRAQGDDAIFIPCDVAVREDVQRVAQAAIDYFGRIDTWVNNAGISIYSRLDEVSEADARRLFDTNFWGVFNGSLVALPFLKRQGGALINIGSEVSEAALPLQGIYTASKHAVKGFTDALRIEIEEVDQAPVSITLIQPTAVDTPFPEHARNYMDKEPKLPDPKIDPADVAEAILDAAVNPTRIKKVGTMSKINTAVAKIAPSIGDRMAAKYTSKQQYDEPPRNPAGSLHDSCESMHLAGRTSGTGGREPPSKSKFRR